ELVGNVLRVRGTASSSATHSIYSHILALTIAHAHRLQTAVRPAEVFEEIVAEYFKAIGWSAAQVGKNRGSFSAALEEVGKATGLRLAPSAAPHSRRANDDKVDVLAHFNLGDNRSGRLTMIGQATVGRSSDWEKKSDEPSARIWGKYLC